jgi:integrase
VLPISTNPFLPSLADIVLLITSVQNVKLSVFLQLLKETAVRAGAAWMVRWADINFQNRLVSIQFP